MKLLHRAFFLLLLTTLLATVAFAGADAEGWNGSSVTQPSKLQTIDGVYYYEISTPEELAYIAITGGDWLNYNYILTNDIVLNTTELTYDAKGNLTADATKLNLWTPIHGFNGIFDGNNFTISGVYMDREDEAGFFRYGDPVIKNLHLKNSYIKGAYCVGGFVSYCSDGSISDCSYDGAVVGINDEYNGYAYAGGIAGDSNTYIKNCVNYGNIFSQAAAGGIAGNADGENLYNCENYGNVLGHTDVGGITGSIGWAETQNCTNHGNVAGVENVGGIAGSYSSIAWHTYYCINNGTVTGTTNVGGIAGSCESDICDSTNNGEVYGEEYTGGIAGYAGEDSSISRSVNKGNVVGVSYTGGIAGYLSQGYISDSYNLGNITGTTNVGGIAGYSDSIWGKGTVSSCYYLQSATVNTALTGFGGTPDTAGITEAKDENFLTLNTNNTLHGTQCYDADDHLCDVCSQKLSECQDRHTDADNYDYNPDGLCDICHADMNAPKDEPKEEPDSPAEGVLATKKPSKNNSNKTTDEEEGSHVHTTVLIGAVGCVVVLVGIALFTQIKKKKPQTPEESN